MCQIDIFLLLRNSPLANAVGFVDVDKERSSAEKTSGGSAMLAKVV